jgi:hypothetical protein
MLELKETDNFKNKGSTIKKRGGGSGGGFGNKTGAPMFESMWGPWILLSDLFLPPAFCTSEFDSVSNRNSAVLVMMPTAMAALSTA